MAKSVPALRPRGKRKWMGSGYEGEKGLENSGRRAREKDRESATKRKTEVHD